VRILWFYYFLLAYFPFMMGSRLSGLPISYTFSSVYSMFIIYHLILKRQNFFLHALLNVLSIQRYSTPFAPFVIMCNLLSGSCC